MANYDGFWGEFQISEEDRGFVLNADYGGIQCFRWKMVPGGLNGDCLRVGPGGVYSFWYGCTAGLRDVSVWVKFEMDSDPRLEIWDIQCGQRVASVDPVGGGDWEKIITSFTAEKKIYLVKMANYGHRNYSQISARLCYFDNLV